MKSNSLTIHADDITEVLNDNVKATFTELQRKQLEVIETHFSKHQTDSIAVLDNFAALKIAEMKTMYEEMLKNTDVRMSGIVYLAFQIFIFLIYLRVLIRMHDAVPKCTNK